jgi:hypothetical protein
VVITEQSPAKAVEAEIDAMVIVNGILTATFAIQNRVSLSNGELDGLILTALLPH